MESAHTKEDLAYYQSLPLYLKIKLSKRRIRDFINKYGENGVCVSVSGKDSAVLLDLVRQDYPNVKGVYVDTGLEFPSVRECNKRKKNVDFVKPEKDFRTILIEYGYPIISKEVASRIQDVRNKPDGYAQKFFDPEGKLAKANSQYYYGIYRYLLDAPFKISAKCCSKMKKAPAKKYQKQNDYKMFIGTLAEESVLRKSTWLKQGCTVFGKNARSMPLSFWTENDILEYIKKYNLDIPAEYGDIVVKNETIEGQTNIYDLFENYEGAEYTTTGEKRTGCMFCMFGIRYNKDRFSKMMKTHPKIADYVLRGGNFKDGMWMPDRGGLGFWFVIKYMNTHGNYQIEIPDEEKYEKEYGNEETRRYLSKEEK